MLVYQRVNLQMFKPPLCTSEPPPLETNKHLRLRKERVVVVVDAETLRLQTWFSNGRDGKINGKKQGFLHTHAIRIPIPAGMTPFPTIFSSFSRPLGKNGTVVFFFNMIPREMIWDTGWWFSNIALFSPLFWGRFPFWRMFFKWVETTHQDSLCNEIARAINFGWTDVSIFCLSMITSCAGGWHFKMLHQKSRGRNDTNCEATKCTGKIHTDCVGGHACALEF